MAATTSGKPSATGHSGKDDCDRSDAIGASSTRDAAHQLPSLAISTPVQQEVDVGGAQRLQEMLETGDQVVASEVRGEAQRTYFGDPGGGRGKAGAPSA